MIKTLMAQWISVGEHRGELRVKLWKTCKLLTENIQWKSTVSVLQEGRCLAPRQTTDTHTIQIHPIWEQMKDYASDSSWNNYGSLHLFADDLFLATLNEQPAQVNGGGIFIYKCNHTHGEACWCKEWSQSTSVAKCQHNSFKIGPNIASGDWLKVSHCYSKEPLKSTFLVFAL